MRYAVVINLDYSSHPEEACREIWGEIRARMIEAGFRCDGRTFTIDADSENQAYSVARNVIEEMESHKDFHEKRVFLYLKDFYGFDMSCTTNLLVPPAAAIELDEEGS